MINNQDSDNERQVVSRERVVEHGEVYTAKREVNAALSRIAYAHYATLDEVVAWLAGHDGELQCVVTGCLPHSRRVGFGCAQSPTLTDYPDDRDVLAWLAALD